MTGTRTYSQVPSHSQPLIPRSNLRREPRRDKLVKQAPRRSGTMGTSGYGNITQTEYTEMLLEEVPFRYSIIACALTWIMLAGFLVLPTTFPKIQMIMKNSHKMNPPPELRSIEKIPLLILGFSCCGVGAIGLCYIWYRVGHNYVWLLSSIFIPGMFNGVSGLISTFVNIYSSQDGIHYDKAIFITIAATGGYTVIWGFLTMIYTILKYIVKRRHDRVSSQGSFLPM